MSVDRSETPKSLDAIGKTSEYSSSNLTPLIMNGVSGAPIINPNTAFELLTELNLARDPKKIENEVMSGSLDPAKYTRVIERWWEPEFGRIYFNNPDLMKPVEDFILGCEGYKYGDTAMYGMALVLHAMCVQIGNTFLDTLLKFKPEVIENTLSRFPTTKQRRLRIFRLRDKLFIPAEQGILNTVVARVARVSDDEYSLIDGAVAMLRIIDAGLSDINTQLLVRNTSYSTYEI